MRRLFWHCTCGEKFEELSTAEPGNNKGWWKAIQHSKDHKAAGEPDRLTGLYDEDGNQVSESTSWVTLVKQGVLQGKQKEQEEAKGTASAGTMPPSPLRGKAVFADVPIGTITYLTIQEFLTRDPDRYPDSSPATLGRVLEDICIAFCVLMRDELATGAMIYQALVDNGWVKPAVKL